MESAFGTWTRVAIALTRHGSELTLTASAAARRIICDGLNFAMLHTTATLLVAISPSCPIFRTDATVREILDVNVRPLVAAGALLQLELLHNRPRACDLVCEEQLKRAALAFIT